MTMSTRQMKGHPCFKQIYIAEISGSLPRRNIYNKSYISIAEFSYLQARFIVLREGL